MNPLLKKIIVGIDSKVPKELKTEYTKAVIAGEKLMFGETHEKMALVSNPEALKDIPETVSRGVSGLMFLLFKRSRSTMSYEVLILAGVNLTMKALDFAERGKGAVVNESIIDETIKKLTEQVFDKLGITKEKAAEAIAAGKQEIAQGKKKKKGAKK
jgi:hypothetical protein